jgi:hypothetical protein
MKTTQNTPRLPFELISVILQERKNIKKLERELEESKKKYNAFVRNFDIGTRYYIIEELFEDEDTVNHYFGAEITEKYKNIPKSIDAIMDLMNQEKISLTECLCGDAYNDMNWWCEAASEGHLG